MSETQQRAFREDALTGHRPTWSFKADGRSREAAAFAGKMGTANQRPAGIPSACSRAAALRPGPRRAPWARWSARAGRPRPRRHGRARRHQARYHELLKRLHPDANGGDRSMEGKLQRVIKAYKTLRAAKLA
jgi:hypothetical protein